MNLLYGQVACQVAHDEEARQYETGEYAKSVRHGDLPATGKQMDAPCFDVFELEDGKIKRFDCYPEGSIIFAQLGVLTNLEAALTH